MSIADVARYELLPTPEAKLADSGPDYARMNREGSGGDDLTTTVFREFITDRSRDAQLLPTPMVGDSKGARNSTATRHRIPPTGIHAGDTLTDAVDILFPTPSAANVNDGEDPAHWEARRVRVATKGINGNGMGKPLAIAAAELSGDIDFGKYAAAIRRAEQIIGRPAPAPAIPDGKGGKHRLHSLFVEWMQMLPLGWVTGRGLDRNAELARLGNGVVPLQAAYAVRELMIRAAADR